MKKSYISKIATVEIPVSNLQKSVDWYTRLLNLHVDFLGEKAAMLSFHKHGTATMYLVETDKKSNLSFYNTNTGVTHSVIDFYTAELKEFYDYLKSDGVEVGTFNVDPDNPDKPGGFGFKDPDGNWLSACNVDHDKSLEPESDENAKMKI